MTTLTNTFDRIDRIAPNAGLYLTRNPDDPTTAYFGTDDITIGVEPLAADLPGNNSHLVTLDTNDREYVVVFSDPNHTSGVNLPREDASDELYEQHALSLTDAFDCAADVLDTHTDSNRTNTGDVSLPPCPNDDCPSPTNATDNTGSTGARSFDDDTQPTSADTANIWFDGASRDNPGHAATGIIIEGHEKVHEYGDYIGDNVTNNMAEYHALIGALRMAHSIGFDDITIRGDSQLIINQVHGEWDANDDQLRERRNTAQNLLSEFDSWSLKHVPRERNSEADDKANAVLDNHLQDE